MTVPMTSLPVGARLRAMPLLWFRIEAKSIARKRAPTGNSTMSAE